MMFMMMLSFAASLAFLRFLYFSVRWITKNKFKKPNQPDRRLKKLQNCKLAINQNQSKRKQNIGKGKRDQRQAVNELKEEDEKIY